MGWGSVKQDLLREMESALRSEQTGQPSAEGREAAGEEGIEGVQTNGEHSERKGETATN